VGACVDGVLLCGEAEGVPALGCGGERREEEKMRLWWRREEEKKGSPIGALKK